MKSPKSSRPPKSDGGFLQQKGTEVTNKKPPSLFGGKEKKDGRKEKNFNGR